MITINNLSEATEQEVFNQVAKHLLDQNEKSMSYSVCSYRGENNLMCAAGCLIPDDEYTEELEGNGWKDLTRTFLYPSEHSELIQELQDVHDSYEVEEWKEKLFGVAEKFGLEFNF
jgi:hypothetical protein